MNTEMQLFLDFKKKVLYTAIEEFADVRDGGANSVIIKVVFLYIQPMIFHVFFCNMYLLIYF